MKLPLSALGPCLLSGYLPRLASWLLAPGAASLFRFAPAFDPSMQSVSGFYILAWHGDAMAMHRGVMGVWLVAVSATSTHKACPPQSAPSWRPPRFSFSFWRHQASLDVSSRFSCRHNSYPVSLSNHLRVLLFHVRHWWCHLSKLRVLLQPATSHRRGLPQQHPITTPIRPRLVQSEHRPSQIGQPRMGSKSAGSRSVEEMWPRDLGW